MLVQRHPMPLRSMVILRSRSKQRPHPALRNPKPLLHQVRPLRHRPSHRPNRKYTFPHRTMVAPLLTASTPPSPSTQPPRHHPNRPPPHIHPKRTRAAPHQSRPASHPPTSANQSHPARARLRRPAPWPRRVQLLSLQATAPRQSRVSLTLHQSMAPAPRRLVHLAVRVRHPLTVHRRKVTTRPLQPTPTEHRDSRNIHPRVTSQYPSGRPLRSMAHHLQVRIHPCQRADSLQRTDSHLQVRIHQYQRANNLQRTDPHQNQVKIRRCPKVQALAHQHYPAATPTPP